MFKSVKLSKKIKAAVFLACFIFSITFILQALLPGSEAPDESQHIEIINFLSKNKRIPVFDGEKGIKKIVFYHHGVFDGAYYSMAYNSPLPYLPYLLTTNREINPDNKGELVSVRTIGALLLALFSLFIFLSLFIMIQNY